MSFMDWIDEQRPYSETYLAELKEDIRNAHCRYEIARNEYKILMELMETAGMRMNKAENEYVRLSKIVEAIK